jgi:hypothetical protein
VTATWPLERLLALCAGWNAGDKTEALAAQLRLTKNALLGKVHRLKALGILEARPSPIMRDGDDPRRAASGGARRIPVPASTLPPLPSDGGSRP